MGVYEINCSKCDTPFSWWSGNHCQLCSKCIDDMGGGIYEIERKYKTIVNNLVGTYYFIGYNEAKNYDDAIKLLIERGVPKEEIIINNDYKKI